MVNEQEEASLLSNGNEILTGFGRQGGNLAVPPMIADALGIFLVYSGYRRFDQACQQQPFTLSDEDKRLFSCLKAEFENTFEINFQDGRVQRQGGSRLPYFWQERDSTTFWGRPCKILCYKVTPAALLKAFDGINTELSGKRLRIVIYALVSEVTVALLDCLRHEQSGWAVKRALGSAISRTSETLLGESNPTAFHLMIAEQLAFIVHQLPAYFDKIGSVGQSTPGIVRRLLCQRYEFLEKCLNGAGGLARLIPAGDRVGSVYEPYRNLERVRDKYKIWIDKLEHEERHQLFERKLNAVVAGLGGLVYDCLSMQSHMLRSASRDENILIPFDAGNFLSNDVQLAPATDWLFYKRIITFLETLGIDDSTILPTDLHALLNGESMEVLRRQLNELHQLHLRAHKSNFLDAASIGLHHELFSSREAFPDKDASDVGLMRLLYLQEAQFLILYPILDLRERMLDFRKTSRFNGTRWLLGLEAETHLNQLKQLLTTSVQSLLRSVNALQDDSYLVVIQTIPQAARDNSTPLGCRRCAITDSLRTFRARCQNVLAQFSELELQKDFIREETTEVAEAQARLRQAFPRIKGEIDHFEVVCQNVPSYTLGEEFKSDEQTWGYTASGKALAFLPQHHGGLLGDADQKQEDDVGDGESLDGSVTDAAARTSLSSLNSLPSSSTLATVRHVESAILTSLGIEREELYDILKSLNDKQAAVPVENTFLYTVSQCRRVISHRSRIFRPGHHLLAYGVMFWWYRWGAQQASTRAPEDMAIQSVETFGDDAGNGQAIRLYLLKLVGYISQQSDDNAGLRQLKWQLATSPGQYVEAIDSHLLPGITAVENRPVIRREGLLKKALTVLNPRLFRKPDLSAIFSDFLARQAEAAEQAYKREISRLYGATLEPPLTLPSGDNPTLRRQTQPQPRRIDMQPQAPAPSDVGQNNNTVTREEFDTRIRNVQGEFRNSIRVIGRILKEHLKRKTEEIADRERLRGYAAVLRDVLSIRNQRFGYWLTLKMGNSQIDAHNRLIAEYLPKEWHSVLGIPEASGVTGMDIYAMPRDDVVRKLTEFRQLNEQSPLIQALGRYGAFGPFSDGEGQMLLDKLNHDLDANSESREFDDKLNGSRDSAADRQEAEIDARMNALMLANPSP